MNSNNFENVVFLKFKKKVNNSSAKEKEIILISFLKMTKLKDPVFLFRLQKETKIL